MKFPIQLILLLICNIVFAQTVDLEQKQKDTLVTNKKTATPTFNGGGVSELHKYINDNFISPNVNRFPGGKEIVKFTIKADGTVSDIIIIKDIGYGVGDQIKKILKNGLKWTPGIKNGKQIDCTFTLPITIRGTYED